uniref:Uncharacterized protein n=1 Tax=Arion vulgaris TaxID=1028688 RepID=A0A0B7B046_9EUPU
MVSTSKATHATDVSQKYQETVVTTTHEDHLSEIFEYTDAERHIRNRRKV